MVSDHLREIERRCLYLTLGCSSMFDYAVRELGYSTGAAWRRLKAMRLCAEVEGARTRLQEGTLTLDAAAQLQHAFERQRRKQSLRTTSGGGAPADAGSATSVVAPSDSAAEPDAPARAALAGTAESPVAPVLDLAARQELVAQAAGKSTRQVQEMLAEFDPELAAPTDRMRPPGPGRSPAPLRRRRRRPDRIPRRPPERKKVIILWSDRIAKFNAVASPYLEEMGLSV